MTPQQALREERRHQRELQRRRQVIETVLAFIFVLALLVAFAIAGTCDYEDEQASLAYWESQGVTIQRW
ncbi:MAG: hypothetical protein IKG11_03145 [Atopobiaceae bacterium]|nr:hypothetical protein [Atopobiaceae bacterium]